MRKTLSFLLGQRSRRLLFRLALSLLVSYGVLKGLRFSAHQSLPHFKASPVSPPVSPRPGPVPADPLVLFYENFESLEGQSWRHFIRKGKTDYQLIEEEGQTVLKAISQRSASGLIRDVRFRPQDYPILSWRWKVETVLEGADLKTKKGSDAVARIYVVFEGKGAFSMERLLNYVWAWNLSKGEVFRSYFSSNSRILVVESGGEGIGRWQIETRNLLEDYRRAFQEEPGSVKAVALMTDSDNTGGEAVAYYDDLKIYGTP